MDARNSLSILALEKEKKLLPVMASAASAGPGLSTRLRNLNMTKDAQQVVLPLFSCDWLTLTLALLDVMLATDKCKPAYTNKMLGFAVLPNLQRNRHLKPADIGPEINK